MLYDLQGAQSIGYRDRGVARYVRELALAVERRAPDAVRAYLLNPDLPLPGGIEPLVASGKLRFVDEPGVYGAGDLLHLASAMDLSIAIDRLVPPAARVAGLRITATVFDLIPLSMPATYLEDPGQRRRYLARLELLRAADGVIAISRFVADDVTARLGVEQRELAASAPRRVAAIPLVASAAFVPPASVDEVVRSVVASVPGLRPAFVLYTGGSDGRKNLEGLVEAWAALPAPLRRRWQLVVAGSLPPLRRNHLEVMATRLGIEEGGFLCTGFVDEPTLVALNQAAGLSVFPSLLEGFGLPAVEAMACGTPTIVADNSAFVELLPEPARFDATSAPAITAAIEHALTDDAHRARLRHWAEDRPRRTWDDVADATLAFWADLPGRRPGRSTQNRERAGREGLRVAFVTPLPPQPGGVAEYSRRLLGPLGERCAVDVYVDGPPHQRDAVLAAEAPSSVASVRPLAALDRVEALRGRYDAVVYCLGNSEFHTGALASLLARREGVVVAHDVRLTTLYRFAPWQHPPAAPGGFAATLHRMYDGRLPDDLGASGSLTADEAERWGVLMTRDAIAASSAFLTTSAFAATLARLDARADHRDRVRVLPFAIDDGADRARRADGDVLRVASFGVLNRLKQGRVLAAACRALQVPLAFVGPAGASDASEVRGDRVEIVGEVDAAEYRRRLAEATIAVQLRSATNGESSAAIGDCLAAGVPTVVTEIGANRALPDDAVVKVPADVDVATLTSVLRDLLADEPRRAALSKAASAYARGRSFEAAADALLDEVRSVASAR
jgi:glycosyltransferase involved in cell wall biosynthesis